MLINLNNRVSYKLALLSVSSAISRGHRVPRRWACSPACCQRSPFPQAHPSHGHSTPSTASQCQQGARRLSVTTPFVHACAHLLPPCSCTGVHQGSSVPGTSRNGSYQACLGSRGSLWVPSTSQRMDHSQQEEASSHFLPRPCSAQAVPVVAGARDVSSPLALLPVTNPQRTPGCSRMQPWGDAELCWTHVYLHPLPCWHTGCRTRLG